MNWLIEHVPFVVLFAGGVAAVAVVWRLLGIRPAAGAFAFLAAVLLFREGRKDGLQAQVTKDTDADRAVRQADAARVDAAVRDADPERLRASDGLRRD